MLYPAELQAHPQPRGVTLSQGFITCLATSGDGSLHFFILIVLQKTVRQEQLFALGSCHSIVDFQGL
jgi:hypothetical protein